MTTSLRTRIAELLASRDREVVGRCLAAARRAVLPGFDDGQAAETDLLHLLVERVEEYAIFLLDPDGRVASWNAGAERIKGYAGAEIVGRPYDTFFTDEDRAAGKPQQLLQRARLEGSVEDEGWRVRKDGGRFWADALLTARDRALAEAELERRRLHELFMQAPAIIAVLRGPEHVFELVNPPYLLSNAAKYSPQDALVHVEVADERLAEGDRVAVVRVRDSGMGIPAANLPHIFERFHRGSNVAGKVSGTGLGLWGARRIVEQHSGSIEVESQDGRGSTFTVRLPLGIDYRAPTLPDQVRA